MADQLNMGGLSIDSQPQRPNGVGGGRSAYIPPHMRAVHGNADGPPPPPPAMNGGPRCVLSLYLTFNSFEV